MNNGNSEDHVKDLARMTDIFGLNPYGQLMSDAPSFFAAEAKKWQLQTGMYYGFSNLYVPFLEGGDVNLKVIQNLAECTPSWGACNNLYLDYGSGELGVTKLKNSAFRKSRPQQISEAAENEYIDFIETSIGSQKLKNCINKAMANERVYGNYVLELSFIEVGGQKSANVQVYDFSMFRYKKKKNYKDPQEVQMGIICEDFRLIQTTQVERVEIAMFPNFTVMPTGEMRTLIHYKNETINRPFYGLPYIHQAFNSIYLDYQQGKFANIQFENQLVVKLIIELFSTGLAEKDEEAKEDFQRRLNEAFTFKTNNSNPKDKLPVAVRMSGNGEENPIPMNVHEIKTENSWQYQETIAKLIDSKILPLAGINEILFKRGGNNLSGGNALEKAELGFFYKSVVPFQDKILSGFIMAIKAIELFFDYTNPNQLQVKLLPSEYLEKIIEHNQMEVELMRKELNAPNQTPQ